MIVQTTIVGIFVSADQPKITDWLMVGLTVAYVFVSILIFFAVKKELSIAMNSERAWIVVSMGWKEGMDQGIFGESVSFGAKTWHVFVLLTCQNHGRTPAWITERRIGLLSGSKEIPKKPPLASARILTTAYQTLLVGTPGYGTEEQVTSDAPIGTEEGRVIYGAVKYRDIYGKSRKTNFGFRIDRNYRLHPMDEYPEYNKHT